MFTDQLGLVVQLGALPKSPNGQEGIPPEIGRRLRGARARSREALGRSEDGMSLGGTLDPTNPAFSPITISEGVRPYAKLLDVLK